jgi:signal transduction histidine kinase/MFS family permease
MINTLILRSIAVLPLIIIGVGLSFWVLLADKKSRANQFLFSSINSGVLFVSLDYLSGFVSGDATLYLLRLSYSFSLVSAAMLFFFALYFPYTSKTRTYFVPVVAVITGVMFALVITTGQFVAGYLSKDWGYDVATGNMIWVYYLFLLSIIAASVGIFTRKYKRSSKIDRSKIILMFVGIIAFVVSEIFFNVILPTLGVQNLYFLGDYSIVIFFGLTAYAIVKHHLFDVRLAIVRSVTYSLVLATFAGIYLAIAYVISAIFNTGVTSTGQIVSGVATSLLLAFIFQPLKRFFDRITNRVFYKDNYNTDDFFARLNKTLSVTTDLRGLLERVSYEIGHTLKAEQAFFFIYTNADGNYISAGTDGHHHLPKHDAILIEQESQGEDKIISASSLDEKDPIRRMMISHRIELILPLMQSDAVIGYLCLGDHLTSGYTNRDIKALNTLSDELIIAVQNALAVHEIREINASLQQRIANATKELRSKNAILLQLDKIKDEFISMASHQLRTPLTSVKGYLSMVIEGDAGKITPSQKQLLDQAFMSSENMVHLINDFLNVSRIQTGKFIIDKSPVDLSELVEQEINSLVPNAKVRNMKLVYKKPKKFPIIDVDEGKMRQVVMNFADNAIYYSHDNSSIIISLGIEGSEIVFTVKDTGIGVPKSEKDKLFAKFYRAANAKIQRPDGTGVGIYLAKKVIDAHGGQIIFESIEGKGSTFGFRLPITPSIPSTPKTPTKP